MMGGSWCLLSATLLLWVTLAVPHPHPIQESDSAEIPERLRELLLIRRLISTLNGWDGSSPTDVQPGMRKRTCYINAGLSHGCDYKDLVGAMAEKNYWDSLNSPREKEAVTARPYWTLRVILFTTALSTNAMNFLKTSIWGCCLLMPGGESSLQHELDQLGKASAANIDFRNLRVTGRSIRSFCSTNTDRQCRNFCFNLGDPACAEGDMGGNGEDSNFLGGANTPGK